MMHVRNSQKFAPEKKMRVTKQNENLVVSALRHFNAQAETFVGEYEHKKQ